MQVPILFKQQYNTKHSSVWRKNNTTDSAFLQASGKLPYAANICLLLLFFQNHQVVCICWTCSSYVYSHSEQRTWISSQETETLFPLLPVTICVTYLEFMFFGVDLSTLLQHELLIRNGPLERIQVKSSSVNTDTFYYMFNHDIFISHQ